MTVFVNNSLFINTFEVGTRLVINTMCLPIKRVQYTTKFTSIKHIHKVGQKIGQMFGPFTQF